MITRETIETKWFKNHVATLKELDGVTILRWAEPGQFCYAMEYIMRGNKLIVTGDLGEAVYDLTWNATHHSFNGIHIGYFMEKLACGQRDRYKFDDELFRKELDEWFVEATSEYEEGDEQYSEYEEIKETVERIEYEYSDYSVIESAVWLKLQDLDFHIEGEEIQEISHFGRRLNIVYESYLIGLQMASKQLKEGGTK